MYQKKTFTKEQVYAKAMSWCAFQERCHKEVRNKLYEWGLHKQDVEELISKLITENFLNEERFACAFAGGKFRIKQWGRVKIKNELEMRNVSTYCINKAMKEISAAEYKSTVEKLIKKKSREIKESDVMKKNYKIAAYLVSRGFESDIIWSLLKE